MLFFLFALLIAASSAHQTKEQINFDTTCTFCEFVIQTCEGFLLNNKTEQEIISWLGSACTLLPSPYNSLCSQELQQYGPQIIQWIATKENPEVVCTQLHLCAVSKTAHVKKVQQATCGICEMVVTYAENYLASNGSITGLEAAIESLCTSLPSPWSTECNMFVEAYVPQLVQWIVSNEPPQKFCASVGLCSARKVAPVKKVQQGTCGICELVVTFAENYLASNGTITGLEAAIEGLCTSLPSPWNTECNTFVEAYVPQLVQWVINNEPPQQFCASVGLCSARKVAPVKKVQQATCGICEMVVTYAENYLASNGSITGLEAAIESLCTALPSPWSTECNMFVEAYVPQLVQWIINNEPPQQFCASVGLCSAKRAPVLPVKKVQQGTCGICELVVTFAENYLASNGTVTGLEAAIEGLCNSLPSPWNTQCDQFVEAYVPQLVQWVINNEPPQQFCASVGLCTAAAKKPLTLRKPNRV